MALQYHETLANADAAHTTNVGGLVANSQACMVRRRGTAGDSYLTFLSSDDYVPFPGDSMVKVETSGAV